MRWVVEQGKQVAKTLAKRGEGPRQESRVRRRIEAMADLPTVRVAVAGAGRYAQQHLEVLTEMANVEIAGVSNRGGSDISWMREKFGARAVFGDYRRMLDETRPDAVFVVVSHEETVRVTEECLRRGIACFIEKPAGFHSDETAALAALAAERSVFQMVGVNRRYLSTLQYAWGEALGRGGILGIHIEAPEAIRRIRRTGGSPEALYEQWLVANSIHALDLFRCLGGEASGLSGRRVSREERNGDSFVAQMELSRGGLGTLVSHWNTAGGWSLTIYGNEIKIDLNLNAAGDVYYASGGKRPLRVDPIDLRFKPGLFAQNEAFISSVALNERAGWPASDLADQVRTMQLIESIAAM